MSEDIVVWKGIISKLGVIKVFFRNGDIYRLATDAEKRKFYNRYVKQ